MRKIRASYNLKILVCGIVLVFCLNNVSYSHELPFLRVQLDTEATDTRVKDAIGLRLTTKERIEQTYETLKLLAKEIDSLIKGSGMLKEVDKFRNWLGQKDKTKNEFFKLKDNLKNYTKNIEEQLESVAKKIVGDEYGDTKYFINLDGNDYFKFSISYDLRDKWGKPVTLIIPLWEDLELEYIEDKVSKFVKGMDDYIELLKNIESPTEDVLRLAQEKLETERGAEDTYRFLALYYNTIIKKQDIITKPDLYSKVNESIKLIIEQVDQKQEEKDTDRDTTFILKTVLKDELEIMKGLNIEELFNKAETIQSTIRKIEDVLAEIDDKNEDKNKEYIEKIIGKDKDETHILFVGFELLGRKRVILQNLRIIKTLLAELARSSIEAYIATAEASRLTLENL